MQHKGVYRGSVLLSYLTQSLTVAPYESFSTMHSSEWECFEIVRLLTAEGFDVDVINWDDTNFIPQKKYDIVIDTQKNLERLSKYLPAPTLKIMYVVASHTEFQNNAEKMRLKELKERRSVTLVPHRTETSSKNIEVADIVVGLGNATTKETYAFAHKDIETIPISSTISFEKNPTKNVDAQKKFLWIGGGGAVLKGLDRVLEAFKDLPDLDLTVCGPVKQENDFNKAYHAELYETQNIHYLGRIDPLSGTFQKIAETHGFLIYPSASEGQSGAVITGLHAGLVPLASRNSGVDVDDFGFVLKTSSVEEIKERVLYASNMPRQEFENLAKKVYSYANEHHTKKTFSLAWQNIIKTIIIPPLHTHE